VTMKMWMQFNVMPRTTLGVDAVSFYLILISLSFTVISLMPIFNSFDL